MIQMIQNERNLLNKKYIEEVEIIVTLSKTRKL